MTTFKLSEQETRWIAAYTNVSDLTNTVKRNFNTGRLDFTVAVRLATDVKEIPDYMKFGIIHGDFCCSESLKSLQNIPTKCWEFTCKSSHITDFSALPICDLVDISTSGIKSLQNILPHIKCDTQCITMSVCVGLRDISNIPSLNIPFNINKIELSCAYVNKGGLGLLTIPGLTALHIGHKVGSRRSGFTNGPINMANTPNAYDALSIICEHLDDQKDGIFGAQSRLLEEGLDRFAEL